MDKQQRTQAKVFAGFLLNSEVRMHLNASELWKNACIDRGANDLTEIAYSETSYVGTFLHEEKITLDFLRDQQEAIRQKLQEYCPKLSVDHKNFYLLSQLFIH